MIKKYNILTFFLIYIIGASAKTILDDVADKLEKEEFQNITIDEYYENIRERDLFLPLVPDEPKTLSEAKCLEYLKNQQGENIYGWDSNIHEKIINISSNSTKENIEKQYLAELPVIYGGHDAKVGQFPHMGAIGWRCRDKSKEWVFKCGSSLISEKFLLTAAHCTKLSPRFVSDIINGDPEVVMLGVENISNTEGTKTRRPKIVKIRNIIVHPEYKAPKKYNDIALVEIDTAIEFTSFIIPACIWSHVDKLPDYYNGATVSITGWGTTEGGDPSSILQVAEVEFLETMLCEELLHRFHNRNWNGFTDKQICAGDLNGGIDTCQGDSGGPLQVSLGIVQGDSIKAVHMIVGITSFGIKCGVRDQPGVYTRVASYVNWIEEHVWKKSN